MKKQVIEIIAIDKRYMETPYPFRPMEDSKIGTWLTGQHIDSSDEKTKGNLTLDEMLGKIPLSDIKRDKFPYVINPHGLYPLWNRRKFDVTKDNDGKPVNPKDFFEFNMFKNYSWMVASSRNTVRHGTDYFYINDVESIAKETVSKEDMIYDATKFIREECTIERYKELALLLNYKIKSFNINVEGMTEVMIRAKLYQACKEHPEEVLTCKGDESNDELFILKASIYGIIKKVGDDFYDGPKFIGKGVKGVKIFMANPENQMYVGKWKTLSNEKEGKTDLTEKIRLKTQEELRNQYKELSLEELKKMCGSKKYKKTEWEYLATEVEVIDYMLSKVR
jgi:hypothetical protein